MSLTLGNDLTGLVSREIDISGRKASGLGESLTTGNDKFTAVIDAFLGNSLRDGEILLGEISKNTSYSINMLTITNEYLTTISSALVESLKIFASAGPISADKLAVLQKNLEDKKEQVNLLINTANFDSKSLLTGDASDIDVQVGIAINDKLKISITDISEGKLFRTSVTNALNEHLSKAPIANNAAYLSQNELSADVQNNVNIIHKS